MNRFYDLFDKTFPYIHIPLMQPIPMALLKKFERHVGEDVIEKLKSDMNVFANCPLNIKQRVYKQDEAFFQQSMLPLLNSYHHDETLQKLAINLKPDSYQEVIEQRYLHYTVRIGGDSNSSLDAHIPLYINLWKSSVGIRRYI